MALQQNRKRYQDLTAKEKRLRYGETVRLPLTAEELKAIDYLVVDWQLQGRSQAVTAMVREYLDYLRREGKHPLERKEAAS